MQVEANWDGAQLGEEYLSLHVHEWLHVQPVLDEGWGYAWSFRLGRWGSYPPEYALEENNSVTDSGTGSLMQVAFDWESVELEGEYVSLQVGEWLHVQPELDEGWASAFSLRLRRWSAYPPTCTPEVNTPVDEACCLLHEERRPTNDGIIKFYLR